MEHTKPRNVGQPVGERCRIDRFLDEGGAGQAKFTPHKIPGLDVKLL